MSTDRPYCMPKTIVIRCNFATLFGEDGVNAADCTHLTACELALTGALLSVCLLLPSSDERT